LDPLAVGLDGDGHKAGMEGGESGEGEGEMGRDHGRGWRGRGLLPTNSGPRCVSVTLLVSGVALVLVGMGMVATAPITGELHASAKAMNEAVDVWNRSPAVERFRRAAVRVGFEGFTPDPAYKMPLSPDWLRDDVVENSEWAAESLDTYAPHKFATEAVGLLGPDRDGAGSDAGHWETPFRATLHVSDGGAGQAVRWTAVDLGDLTLMKHTVQPATSWKNCRNVIGGVLDARGCHTYHALNALCIQLRWDEVGEAWQLDKSDEGNMGRCYTGKAETIRLTPPVSGGAPHVPPERMAGVGHITVRLGIDPWLTAVRITGGHPEMFAEASKKRYATGIVLMIVGIVLIMPVLFGVLFRIWFEGDSGFGRRRTSLA